MSMATCVMEVMEYFWKYFDDVKISTFDASVRGRDCGYKESFHNQKENKRNYWDGERKFGKAGFIMCHIKICVKQSLDEMKRNPGFFRSLKKQRYFH